MEGVVMAEQVKEAEGQVKEAAEVRMRAFEVGIAHLCKDAGISYDALAKTAGQSIDALGPALVEQLAALADAEEKK